MSRRRSVANDVAAFWAKVQKTDGCWLWQGKLDRNGYGRHSVGGRVLGAHVASWRICWGGLPDGLCVLHRCDNPRCVNPEHLFLGTRGDNARDMSAKGRAHLQRNPRAFAGDRHWTHRRPELVKRKGAV